MTNRDYSSVYSIKDFALNELMPKYFDTSTVNQLNIGLLGYVTDLVANTTEDTMNAFSMYIREIFPNIAQLPETLYNNAARLQIDQLMATAATMNVIIFVSEKDVLTKGTAVAGGVINFIIDSELIIDIEGKQFMLDYDINISATPYRGDSIFMATYDTSFINSLSDIKNPYIKTRRVKLQNENYLGLILAVHQVNKFETLETLISNDKINLPTLTFNFNDQLANFEVFYKAPGTTAYTQLKKQQFNGSPIKDPFCFYRLRDDTTVEISFTLRDGYFQPLFNSDILIRYYTTTGIDGNFPLYQGNNFIIIPKSENYDYNNNLIMFGISQTASIGGSSRLDLESLRSQIVEKTSVSGAYTNENDLQLFFNSNKSLNNTDTIFIKRRDDALERLFSSFSLFRDTLGDIYPTNTLELELVDSDFDAEFDSSGRYLFKPGHLCVYKDTSVDIVQPVPLKTLSSDLSTIPDEFIYTNPFLIVVTKTPGIVGYYLNSVKQSSILDYSYVNQESPVQFICNNLTVSRNSMGGEDFYTLTVTLLPTTDSALSIVDGQGVPTGNLIMRGTIEDLDTTELCMFKLVLIDADPAGKFYTFQTKLYTDDYTTTAQKFRIKDVNEVIANDSSILEDKVVPMYNCTVNLHAFYKVTGEKFAHKYDYNTELEPYSLTNTYSTRDDGINFITPMNMMRSQIKYIDIPQPPTPIPGNPLYYMQLSFVPFIRASTMKITSQYDDFIEKLYAQYFLLQTVLDKITNNFGVDMKFFKTYGRSKNFTVGESSTILDKVNISITFKVAPIIGAVEADLIRNLKIFIKNFIENINSSGYNFVYISNLIRNIENNFSDVDYLKFVQVNNYDSSIQIIRNKGIVIELMTKEERRQYVPEYLSISLDDIIIDILSI